MDFLILNPLNFPILSTLIFLPLAGALVIFFLKNETAAKVWTLLISLVTYGIVLAALFLFRCLHLQVPVR